MIEPTGFVRLAQNGLDRLKVRPGTFLSFRVLKNISSHTWLIHLNGRQVKVFSTFPLEAGKYFRALVLLKAGVLTLKVQEPPTAAQSVIERFALPDNAQVRLIVQAFMEQGTALKEEILNRAIRFFRTFQPVNRKNARLLALLFDKGIYPDHDSFTRFLDLLREPGGNFYQNPGQKDGRGSSQENKKDPGREQDEKKEKEVALSIAAKMQRKGPGDNLLQLFNHLRAGGENWLVFPIDFTSNKDIDPDKTIKKGIVRLHLDAVGRTDSFSVSFYGKKEYHFRGGLTAPQRRINFFMDRNSGTEAEGRNVEGIRIIEELRKKLHNLSFEIDDTIKGTEKFFPFGEDDLPEVRKIDTIV